MSKQESPRKNESRKEMLLRRRNLLITKGKDNLSSVENFWLTQIDAELGIT